jgi:TetR/AcrR family transcriptional repressor of nem operon
MNTTESKHQSKIKLLDAALYVIRSKGYSATRIEDVCEAAGLTKGSFFHHFKGKEDLAIAAAHYWDEVTSQFFEQAPYHLPSDPIDRVLAYIDFRKDILQGELAEYTCLLGTMLQETYDTHPAIREACEKGISDHAATIERDITAALESRELNVSWTASSLAFYIQATIQGAFILAKAKNNSEVAAECLDHLRRYLELIFVPSSSKEN